MRLTGGSPGSVSQRPRLDSLIPHVVQAPSGSVLNSSHLPRTGGTDTSTNGSDVSGTIMSAIRKHAAKNAALKDRLARIEVGLTIALPATNTFSEN